MVLRILALVSFSASALGAQSGLLFSEAFRVEHHLEQMDESGDRMISEAVLDTYGGSWIVSERPDGSRMIVDFSRREVTEIRPQRSAFWTVSFDRLGELHRRLAAAEGLTPAGRDSSGLSTAATGTRLTRGSSRRGTSGSLDGSAAPEVGKIVVREARLTAGVQARPIGATAGVSRSPLGARGLASRPGTRHLVAVERKAEGAERELLEAWLDPTLKLSRRARTAIASLDAALGGSEVRGPTPAGCLAAIRDHAGGALVVATSRSLAPAASASAARLEDIATRVERLDAFPQTLLEIPEGYLRIPHPLEAAARYLEEDAELRHRISHPRSRNGGVARSQQ